MSMNKVLAAVDATDGGRKALELAISVTENNPDAVIDLVYVVPIPLLDDSQMTSFRSILEMMMNDGKSLLERLVGAHEDAADRLNPLLITGTNPATEIVKLIDQGDYDLVVIGNRGLSGMKEYMGSVSHKVLHGSSVPVLIAIAVSSNLQGAATLVGDTTSILLGGFAGMNFFDFFWMEGRPGIFWSVELGALASLGVLFWLFRDQRQPVHVTVETEVEDDVPTALLLLTVGLLIAASFLPEPSGGVLHLLYTLRSGLVCMGLCLFGAARACWRSRSLRPLAETFRALDYDTLLLLFSLFILLEGVSRAGVIDAAAQLFHSAAGDEPLHLYLLLVAASVGLSAFIDNIPYVAAMLPVVQGVAALMNGGAGIEPELFYFGLLTGATLGGNLTPIGASANIAAIGILRKNGETVRTRDFLRIGVPFTLAAVLVGAGSLWLFWGI